MKIFWKKLERLKRENTISVYLAQGINSSVNPFITKKQMAFQQAVMDEDSMARRRANLRRLMTGPGDPER